MTFAQRALQLADDLDARASDLATDPLNAATVYALKREARELRDIAKALDGL